MIFTTDIKVRGHQCDAYGHVNNARWVELLEEARWRWLDEDIDLDLWREKQQGMVVLNIEVSYRRPAFPNDDLEFRCWFIKVGGRTAVCRQAVFRALPLPRTGSSMTSTGNRARTSRVPSVDPLSTTHTDSRSTG